MNWFPKKLTDEEIIENIRKIQRTSKWITAFFFVLSIILFLIVSLTVSNFEGILNFVPAEEKYFVWSGFIFGIIFGFIASFMLGQAIHLFDYAFTILNLDRKDKLLLKYHDKLIELEKKK